MICMFIGIYLSCGELPPIQFIGPNMPQAQVEAVPDPAEMLRFRRRIARMDAEEFMRAYCKSLRRDGTVYNCAENIARGGR